MSSIKASVSASASLTPESMPGAVRLEEVARYRAAMRPRLAIRGAKTTAAFVLCRSGAVRLIARGRHRDAFAVAMYHGLVRQPLEVDEWCFLDEARFVAQMIYLRRHFNVVHLDDAPDAARAAHPNDRPVACVTFDDGFASVYESAWPVLQRLQIPATIYVVSGLVDSDETVWFAKLHEALTRTSAETVEALGHSYPLVGNAARSEASQGIQRALKRLPCEQFAAELDRVHSQLGVTIEPGRDDHLRMLTSAQIGEMAASGIVRFGGHTESHQILTLVPSDVAQEEIRRSVATITDLGGRATTSFAYPNGGTDDYDDAALEELRRLGIPLAVTTSSGPNWPASDMLRLRRYGIGSRDALDTFAWKMHHGSSRLSSLRLRTLRRNARPRY